MLHELNRLGFWPFHGLVYLASVVVVTLSRFFGLGGLEAGFFALLALTAIQFGVGYPLQTAGAQAAMRVLPAKIPFWAQLVIGCVALAPLAALLMPVGTWLAGITPLDIPADAGRSRLFGAIAERYPFILLASATMGTALWMLFNYSWYRAHYGPVGPDVPASATPDAEPGDGATPIDGAPAFLRKLPFEKRGTLWAITAEQHYLRVYTDKGDDLILMRFSDALDQLAALEGLQVHRSHWVAREGVERLEKEDKKLSIVLKNGVTVPVSRPNIAAVNIEFGTR